MRNDVVERLLMCNGRRFNDNLKFVHQQDFIVHRIQVQGNSATPKIASVVGNRATHIQFSLMCLIRDVV